MSLWANNFRYMKYKRPLDDIPFLADVCVLGTVIGVGVKNALIKCWCNTVTKYQGRGETTMESSVAITSRK